MDAPKRYNQGAPPTEKGRTLKQAIIGQFKKPSGALGILAGIIMALRPSNRRRIFWTLDLLDIQPGDRTLEIGFGPGIGLARAAALASKGFVAGVDHSPVMFKMASFINGKAIAEGRIRLALASVEDAPDFGERFDKIYMCNVAMFVKDPAGMMNRLAGALAPGGKLAAAYMPRMGGGEADAIAEGDRLAAMMTQAGLTQVAVHRLETKPAITVCAVGIRR